MDQVVIDQAEHRSRFPLVLLGIVVVSLIFVMLVRKQLMDFDERSSEPVQLTNIRPAPAIHARGWLNGPPLATESLKGKVVVLEGFASWCDPCARFVPQLAKLHRRFAEQGVIFISLTSEEEEDKPLIQQFIDGTGVAWPVGYGATETLRDLDLEYIPATWIISREGQIVWMEGSPGRLEDAIEATLQLQPASPPPMTKDARRKQSE
ncbi:MAG: TlpA family protein disulfide reductase [Planctomycetaceae bacterium]